MARTHYKYIVIGCGAFGSSAAYWLSKEFPHDVLALEKFKLNHCNASSHGPSRIIRYVYQQDYYTNIAHHAYDAWNVLEKDCGMQVFFKTGALVIHKKSLTETRDSYNAFKDTMLKCGKPVEVLTGPEISRRWPGFDLDEDFEGVLDPSGGLVDASLANALHVQVAERNGVTVIEECPVTKIKKEFNNTITVTTPKGVFTCERLICTAGPWTNNVLDGVNVKLPLTVSEENLVYFATKNIELYTKERFPVFWFLFGNNKNGMYAFPAYGVPAFKGGMHMQGKEVTGDTRTFVPEAKRTEFLTAVCKAIVPKAVSRLYKEETCLYTMTPDNDLLLDSLKSKGHPEILVAIGDGHGYKWAGYIGRMLARMAIEQKDFPELWHFRVNRPAMTNPSAKPRHGWEIAGDLSKL